MIYRVETSKNAGVYTRVHTFYNLVQKVNPEENSVFVKTDAMCTRDTTPGVHTREKVNPEQIIDF